MDFHGSGAQILVESLHRSGVDTIFGLPGDTGVAFYDALFDAGERIRHILARDERSAAMMADAYARCSNRVGVVEASSGGGTTFVVGGLGEAYAASVPILVVTSDIHRGSRGTGALTEIDQTALFSAVTKWAATAESAAEIPNLVATALNAATTGRPGPVSLVIPEDVLDEKAAVSIPEAMSRDDELPRDRLAVPNQDLDAVIAALNDSERPAIIAGSGVHISQAWHELADLVDKAGIPVATSIHGKGSLAENSPWSLGVAGANGAREYANQYLATADVVLFVGTRANATDTNSYRSPPREGVVVVGIDVDPGRAGNNYPDSVKLVGDARTILGQIRERAQPGSPERSQRLQSWIAAERHDWEVADRGDHGTREDQLCYPADVIRAVHEMVPPDTLVIADPGTATPNVAAYWELTKAGRTIIVPRGHGPMGYAIPAAIGAAIARPGREVVAFTGDGSFAMSCGELETVSRLGLPVTYVQFTNGSMGWIKMLQHLYHGRRYFSVDLGPSNAATVADGFGVRATSVSTLADFVDAFKEVGDGRPSFIDVAVPEETEVVPPVAPWQRALAGETGRPVY